jgi:hypothetical protein
MFYFDNESFFNHEEHKVLHKGLTQLTQLTPLQLPLKFGSSSLDFPRL